MQCSSVCLPRRCLDVLPWRPLRDLLCRLLSLIQTTLSYENFMREGWGVLQFLSPEHACLVHLLGETRARSAISPRQSEHMYHHPHRIFALWIGICDYHGQRIKARDSQARVVRGLFRGNSISRPRPPPYFIPGNVLCVSIIVRCE